MATKTETTTPAMSHRLVNLRAKSAGCSCGATYVGEGSADLRAQHKAHKAAPVAPAARKAPTRKAAPAPAAKPRARKAAAK